MHKRIVRKSYLLYPEDKMKGVWDFIVSLTLLVMCIYTPIYISFSIDEDLNYSSGWHILNYVLDFIFLIDIFIVFLSAFYNEDFKMVDDISVIACNYIQGWFIIDVVAIIPFDFFIIDSKT